MDHLTFAPRSGEFFLWRNDPRPAPCALSLQLREVGWPATARIVDETGSHQAEGTLLELLDVLPVLAAAPQGQPGSLGVWAAAARVGLGLVLQGRLVPRLRPRHGRFPDLRAVGWEARWEIVAHGERERLRQLVARLPEELAVPTGHHGPEGLGWTHGPGAAGLLRGMLDACADTLVREASWRGAVVRLRDSPADAWEQRLVHALSDVHARFAAGAETAALAEQVNAWAKDQGGEPSMLPSPESWRPREQLEEVLQRMIGPAGQLARRLLQDHEAPRTLDVRHVPT